MREYDRLRRERLAAILSAPPVVKDVPAVVASVSTSSARVSPPALLEKEKPSRKTAPSHPKKEIPPTEILKSSQSPFDTIDTIVSKRLQRMIDPTSANLVTSPRLLEGLRRDVVLVPVDLSSRSSTGRPLPSDRLRLSLSSVREDSARTEMQVRFKVSLLHWILILNISLLNSQHFPVECISQR
jgi:hypothetical protein